MRLRGFDKFEGPVLIDTETVGYDEIIECGRQLDVADKLDDRHFGMCRLVGLDVDFRAGEMGLAVALPEANGSVYGTIGIIIAFVLIALCKFGPLPDFFDLVEVSVRPECEFIAKGEIGARPVIIFDGDISLHEPIEGLGAFGSANDIEESMSIDVGLDSARSVGNEIELVIVGKEVMDEIKSFAVKGRAIGDSVRIDISGQGDETLIGIDFNELVFAIGDVIDVIEIIDEIST